MMYGAIVYIKLARISFFFFCYTRTLITSFILFLFNTVLNINMACRKFVNITKTYILSDQVISVEK
jgi:hypothetical protein